MGGARAPPAPPPGYATGYFYAAERCCFGLKAGSHSSRQRLRHRSTVIWR